MRKSWSKILFVLIWLTALSGTFIGAKDCAASEPFPIYPAIRPNVAFWKKVFTEHPGTEGLIHDSRHLRLVYDVIKLVKPGTIKGRKINRNRVKKASEKYKKILMKLSTGAAPGTPDERRVAALFGKGAKRANYRKASERIRCQTGLRDRFKRGLIRSGAYIDEIRKIFRSHGLPEDLSYLPHVESSFNLRAYSKAGAAGIWQFMLSTGKQFMKVGYTVDERWDPLRASHAAARLLKKGYETLGHWPLALTSYNHGISGMLRAKRSKGGYEAIFKGYRSRSFKFASRNFYSEFLAARDVAKNYKKYFGALPLKRPVKSREMVLKGYVSIKDLADYFNIEPARLRSLNPSLREPVFKGQKYIPKGFALRLPSETGRKNVITTAGLPKRLYQPRQKRTRFYRVRKGDTAGKVARMQGVKLSDLLLANNLRHRSLIYAGQNLRIPARDEIAQRVTVAKAVKQKDIEPISKKAPSRAMIQPVEVLVKKAPPKKLAKKTEAVPETRVLPVNPGILTGNFVVEKVLSKKGRRVGIIKVEVEETLGHYAEWLGIATRDIRRLNGFRPRKVIRVNDSLKIPLEKISKEDFEEKRFEYHKELQEDFFASYRVKDVEIYQIKNGDNIWTLCQEVFEVPFWLIYQYNSELNINRLSPSQKLIVPRVEVIGET